MRKKHGSVPKIHTCSGPDSHNEQTPALKVTLQTELRFRLRRYEQPPMIGGPAEQQKADGWLAAARSSSGDDDFCSERPTVPRFKATLRMTQQCQPGTSVTGQSAAGEGATVDTARNRPAVMAVAGEQK
jgi:hypothetical protein